MSDIQSERPITSWVAEISDTVGMARHYRLSRDVVTLEQAQAWATEEMDRDRDITTIQLFSSVSMGTLTRVVTTKWGNG